MRLAHSNCPTCSSPVREPQERNTQLGHGMSHPPDVLGVRRGDALKTRLWRHEVPFAPDFAVVALIMLLRCVTIWSLGARVAGATVSLAVGTTYKHDAPLNGAPTRYEACAVRAPLQRGVPWSGAITFLPLA